uniref:Uncharacterized protein n=1 Tax=Romanomermis culicivorax TaxID=13658 RepID=A0A915KP01_ROMCU
MFYRQLVKTTINSFGRRTRLVATMAKFSEYANSAEKWSTRRIAEFQIRNFSSKIDDSKSSTAPFSGELTNEDIDKMCG